MHRLFFHASSVFFFVKFVFTLIWLNSTHLKQRTLTATCGAFASVISVGVLTHRFSSFCSTGSLVSSDGASQISGAPKSEQCTQQTSRFSNVSIPIFYHPPLPTVYPRGAAIPCASEHTRLMVQREMLLKNRFGNGQAPLPNSATHK